MPFILSGPDGRFIESGETGCGVYGGGDVVGREEMQCEGEWFVRKPEAVPSLMFLCVYFELLLYFTSNYSVKYLRLRATASRGEIIAFW